jgi:hypothetical protein
MSPRNIRPVSQQESNLWGERTYIEAVDCGICWKGRKALSAGNAKSWTASRPPRDRHKSGSDWRYFRIAEMNFVQHLFLNLERRAFSRYDNIYFPWWHSVNDNPLSPSNILQVWVGVRRVSTHQIRIRLSWRILSVEPLAFIDRCCGDTANY